MREIKFRALNKVTGSVFDLKKFTQYIVNPEKQPGIFIPFDDDIEVMQYTGLKDKNGKEIYEGDIVLYEPDYIKLREKAAVSWDDLGWRPFLYSGGGEFEPSYCTVIGNIYEHSYLLDK